MTATLPTGRRGQVLALAITVTAAASLWLGVAAPLADWYAARAQAFTEQAVLAAHMQAIAAMLPALRRAAPAAPRGAGAFLTGRSDALAAAELQARVNRLAAGVGVTPTSLETLPAVSRGGHRRVGLRVALTAPWPKLVDLLLAMRAARPRMLLDDVEFRGLPAQSRTGSPPVDAGFAVYAFRASGS